jgi:hypothetical protein
MQHSDPSATPWLKPYTGYLGGFDQEHKHPPAPFNPTFDPLAAGRYAEVAASMTADGLYDTMPIEKRREEWRRRYDALKARDDASRQGRA